MSTKYELALETNRKATAVFLAIRADYRAGKIKDADFLAAKAIYDAANKEYDAAYAMEQEAGQEGI